MNRQYFLAVIGTAFLLLVYVTMTSASAQHDKLDFVSESHDELIIKLEQDRQITQRVNDLIQQRQEEVLELVQNNDIGSIRVTLSEVSTELATIQADFVTYQKAFKDNQITVAALESKLNATNQQLEQLEARYSMLNVAVDALEGNVDQTIIEQLGDIEKLKEDIKQQILQELNKD